MKLQDRKQRAATVSLAYNAGLTAIKLIAAALTGSVSMLSEGVHSGTDVVASVFALMSVRAAAIPPDEDHPYGHGKIESVASFGESILLLGIVAYIGFEALQRVIHFTPVRNVEIGIWVMGVSAVSSLLVAQYVQKVGAETGSLALRSNGQHLMVDFWTSVGVLAALFVTHLTGWALADPLFAFGLAVWIANGAWKMVRESYDHLVDRALPPEELERINKILDATEGCLSWHQLRARHSGEVHYVDAHVVVPREWSVVQAHDLADRIESEISIALAPCHVVIHIDPDDPEKIGGEIR